MIGTIRRLNRPVKCTPSQRASMPPIAAGQRWRGQRTSFTETYATLLPRCAVARRSTDAMYAVSGHAALNSGLSHESGGGFSVAHSTG